MSVYNLDKNFLKIGFHDSYWENEHKFTELYKLIYGENPNEWSGKNMGDWQDLGKLKLKQFQNGSANIKGDIKIIREHLYAQLSNGCLIYYNKTKEIRENLSDS